MKKIISLSTLFVAVMILFSSCGKYEEGPAISLKSKEARVAGTYQIVDVYKNGEQNNDTELILGLMALVETTFEKDGTGEMSSNYTIDGTEYSSTQDLEWMFSEDETKLLVRTKDDGETTWGDWEESTIIRLTDTEIWTQEYDEFDDLWEYHFEEK
jgi:hypothetical protein